MINSTKYRNHFITCDYDILSIYIQNASNIPAKKAREYNTAHNRIPLNVQINIEFELGFLLNFNIKNKHMPTRGKIHEINLNPNEI